MTRALFGPLLALALWFALCYFALLEAGVPYQCSTDTECEALHGADSP